MLIVNQMIHLHQNLFFNKSTYQKASSQPSHQQSSHIRSAASSTINVLHDEHSDTPISQIRLLEDKINVQTKALTHQQFDITNLHKAVFSILDRLDHIASAVTNTSRSSSPPFRPNSLPNHMHQPITHASPVKHTSLPVTDPVPALQQM